MNKRNEKIDFLKGIAIFLVVYGHSIQYCIGDGIDFFLNPIFKIIYSFHMPLFMMISGYLYFFSLNKNKNGVYFIKKRFKQLIIPALSWYTLYSLLIIIAKVIIKKSSISNEIIKYIKGIPYQFWFLFILFYLSCIFIVGKNKFNDKGYYHCVVFILLLLLPDKLNMQYLKFMYPYFLVGYLYNKNKELFNNKLNIIKLLSMILFIVLIVGWKKDYYIYTTGMTFYNVDIAYKIIIISYRYVIGLVGSISVISILEKLYKFDKYNIFSKVGKYTLSIYIIQTYMMIIIDKLSIKINNTFIYNLIFTPIVAIVTVSICLAIRWIISKNDIGSIILLGAYRNNIIINKQIESNN